MEKEDKIRSITLRLAVFFGLTTFTLCIGIFYIESVIDDNNKELIRKDSVISTMKADLDNQLLKIQENEAEVKTLREELSLFKSEMNSDKE